MTKRRYNRRTDQEKLDALMIQIQKLDLAAEKRAAKIGRLRNEAQRLTNALTPVAEVQP